MDTKRPKKVRVKISTGGKTAEDNLKNGEKVEAKAEAVARELLRMICVTSAHSMSTELRRDSLLRRDQ